MPLTLALAVAGCGDDSKDGTGSGGADQQSKNESAEVSVFGTEPANPLLPGMTAETGGGKIIDAMFTGLIDYEPTGTPRNAHAEKIDTSPDGKTMTFTLKKGWKFHDGTDVKAKNYVDAWNYTAYSPNGQQNGSFFAQVQGFSDVNTEDPDGEDGPQKAPQPKTDKLTGLKVNDDYSFTATFTEPHPIFKIKLGYPAYSPMPDSFFKDPKAFEDKPVGNGPFQFVSRVPKQELKVERFEGYQGADKPKIKKVKFSFTTTDAAYAEVKSNKLDFLDTIPPSGLAGNLWKQDLKARSGSTEILSIQVVSFPLYDEKYKNVDFRRAVSMAINRDEITKKIFEGNRTPVHGYGIPNLPGWTDGACGSLCDFKPDEARALLAKSGFTGTLEITSNADGGHKEWIEAACGSIKNAIGLDCQFVPVQAFGEIRKKIDAKQMNQVYRSGWLVDYPLVENFLSPIYRTGASSNDNGYSNPAVDAKLAEADKASTEEESFKLYHQAEEMIAQDMPAVPLWTNPAQWGHSERLKNVRMTFDRELDLSVVEIA